MKKTLLIVACCFACLSLFAQDLTLTFTAKTDAGDPVRMKKIEVKNLTKDWMETLIYPDTVLTFKTDGVQDYVNDAANMMLQNIPNPFNGVTDVMLNLAENDRISLEIHDINGKLVQSYRQNLMAGMHVFHITLNAPQTYMLSVKTKYHKAAIKMVNLKSGGQNQIEYRGNADMMSYGLFKGKTENKYDIGDEMSYQGYTMVDGEELQSEVLNKTLTGSELITLLFSYKPVISEVTVSEVSYHSAKLSAEVISSPSLYVNKKGFCYALTEEPTLAHSVVEVGRGVGAMEHILTGLDDDQTYYVRAYIVRSDSTYYSNVTSFSTLIVGVPTVVTDTVTAIAFNSAVCGGEVTDDAGAEVLRRGVCWSTEEKPTTADAHTEDGIGLGAFVSTMKELTPNTTYYVRAYAENKVGVVYGEQKEFTTKNLVVSLKVKTLSTDSITRFQANAYGNVTCEDSIEITDRGFCYGVDRVPTLGEEGYKSVSAGNGIGDFSAMMTDLEAATVYYYRAYAASEVGVVYGETDSFKTKTCADPEVSIVAVMDIVADGAIVLSRVIDDGGTRLVHAGSCLSEFGVPSVDDSLSVVITNQPNSSFNSVYKELKPNTRYYVRAWAQNSCTEDGEVGDQNGRIIYSEVVEFSTISVALPEVITTATTDITTTTAQLHGTITGTGGGIVTERGFCWSLNPEPEIEKEGCEYKKSETIFEVKDFSLSLENLQPGKTYYFKAYAVNEAGAGYSKQDSLTTLSLVLPVVVTYPMTGVSTRSASASGMVSYDGGAAVTARGICWSTDTFPTVNDNITVEGEGLGSFFSKIEGLTPSTTYFVRAYATNEIGTAYGDTVSFTTLEEIDEFVCGKSTIKDVDGNEYYTVQVGFQCWMKDNMRTRHFADGAEIKFKVSTSTNYSDPCGYTLNSIPEVYGLLYNKAAYMRGAANSNEEPSGVQGVCPDGWHLPSKAECQRLVNYVTAEHYDICEYVNPKNISSLGVAKALAAPDGWYTSASPCTPGYESETNNVTGMTMYPVGIFSGKSTITGSTQEAYMVTSSVGSGDRNAVFGFYYSDYSPTYVSSVSHPYKQVSVRCLKDYNPEDLPTE